MAYDKTVDSAALDGIFAGIAGAIREKNSSTKTYAPEEMAAAIGEISTESSLEDQSPFTLQNAGNTITARITAVDCAKGGFLPTGNSYANLFNSMTALQTIENLFIPSTVTRLDSLFYSCYFKSAPMDWGELAAQVGHVTSAGSMFGRGINAAYKDVVLRDFHWTNCTGMGAILYDNAETTLDVSGWTFPKLTAPPGIHWNRSLTTLTIDGWDFSNITSFGNPHWIAQDWKLSTILGTFTGLGNKMSTVSFSELVYNASNPHVGFDTDTVTRIIDALVTKTDGGTYTLKFSPNTEANTTAEQIAAAAEKGWTVTFG